MRFYNCGRIFLFTNLEKRPFYVFIYMILTWNGRFTITKLDIYSKHNLNLSLEISQCIQ